MNSKTKAYIIEAATPQSDGKNFFAGTFGWSGCSLRHTVKREEAQRFRTKKEAEAKLDELFNPGFMRVVFA